MYDTLFNSVPHFRDIGKTRINLNLKVRLSMAATCISDVTNPKAAKTKVDTPLPVDTPNPNITRAVAGWQPWTAISIVLAVITTICVGFQAEELQVHPWYIMLPAAISCSFAFMLPVATPPNAIVFSGGHLKVKDMVGISTTFNLQGFVLHAKST